VFATTATTVARMLSDRPYLRGDYQEEKTSALTWLLSAIIAGFVLQVLFGASWMSGAGDRLENLLGLTIPAFQDGWVWTLFTHSFLHRPGFIFHVVGNCLALYFLGRELIPMLGTRRFLGVYAVATVVSGLTWTATHWRFGSGDLIGATSAVYALFFVFTCFAPNRPMNFLLFFVFPVTLKPKHVAAFLAGLDVFVFLVYELPGAKMPLDMTIASSAHLGGILTGLLYFRYVHNAAWFNPEDRPETAPPRWSKRARKSVAVPAALEASAPPTPSSREDIRAEVDRILDKINSHGFSALTPEEKRILDDAKDMLSRP
jgi:membrane associated rhomboid family serine protease